MDSMWTAGLIRVWSEGQDQSWDGAEFLVLQQFLGTVAVHKTVVGLAHRLWSKHIFFSYSFRAAYVDDLVCMLFCSVNQCLVKRYNLIQTKFSVTSGHSGGWVAKVCSLNAFLPLSSNILILWPNTYKPPRNANAFRINGNLYVFETGLCFVSGTGITRVQELSKIF